MPNLAFIDGTNMVTMTSIPHLAAQDYLIVFLMKDAITASYQILITLGQLRT